ncbi:hypothetical protein GCM10028808_57600 [Spirosoma migulaei]
MQIGRECIAGRQHKGGFGTGKHAVHKRLIEQRSWPEFITQLSQFLQPIGMPSYRPYPDIGFEQLMSHNPTHPARCPQNNNRSTVRFQFIVHVQVGY